MKRQYLVARYSTEIYNEHFSTVLVVMPSPLLRVTRAGLLFLFENAVLGHQSDSRDGGSRHKRPKQQSRELFGYTIVLTIKQLCCRKYRMG